MGAAQSKNMRLLSNDRLNGFGGVGEGMAMQIAKDGRRIMWLAHEGPPKNFTAVDVSDPRQTRIVCQTDLPHARMRSNSLDITGDLMVVCYQVADKGDSPAGIE